MRILRDPGRRELIYVIPHRFDRMSAGQTGHFHGTNRTCPRDGCSPEVGVSRRISLSLLVLLFLLTCCGLHESYVMSRSSVPRRSFMHVVVLLEGGVVHNDSHGSTC